MHQGKAKGQSSRNTTTVLANCDDDYDEEAGTNLDDQMEGDYDGSRLQYGADGAVTLDEAIAQQIPINEILEYESKHTDPPTGTVLAINKNNLSLAEDVDMSETDPATWHDICKWILANKVDTEDLPFWTARLAAAKKELVKMFPNEGGVFNSAQVKAFMADADRWGSFYVPHESTRNNLKNFITLAIAQLAAAANQNQLPGRGANTASDKNNNNSEGGQTIKRQKTFSPKQPQELLATVELKKELSKCQQLEQYEWVATEERFREKIYDAWSKNTSAWPTTRANDYNIMTVGGGSGIGKTTTGREMQKILERKFGGTFGFSLAKLDGGKAVMCHIFLLPHSISFVDYPHGYSAKRKPPRIPSHITLAGQKFALAIACSYFFDCWAGDLAEIDEAFDGALRDMDSVVQSIRLSLGLNPKDVLILNVQFDEFQKASYVVLNIMRYISDAISAGFFEKHRVLIAPMPTGTAMMSLEYIEEAIGASALHSALIPVERLPDSSSRQLTLQFARIPPDGAEYKGNLLFDKLVCAGGGIPILQKIIGGKFLPDSNNNRPRLDDMDDAHRLWRSILALAKLQYPKSIWEESFGDVKYIFKLLAIAVLRKRVTYSTQLNGTTIGDHLESGVLFPTDVDDGRFHLTMPQILLFSVAELFDIPLLHYLEPFVRVDEDGFEKYIGAFITVLCQFYTVDGDHTLTAGEFFAGGLGTPKTLATPITIQKGISYKESHDVVHPGAKVTVVQESVASGAVTIDHSEGKHVVRSRKRGHTGDIYPPFANVQVKSSAYISRGQPPPAEYYVQVAATGNNNLVSVTTERKKAGPGLFVLISNKPFRAAEDVPIPEGVVIICADNLKAFLRSFATANVYCPL